MPDSQPQVSSSEQRSRATSPNAQGLITRIEEKKNLQSLNDRLANYIDTVRRLEVENRALTVRIQTSEESFTQEFTSAKGIYTKQIEETQKNLDKIANEKMRLQVEAARVTQDYGELQSRSGLS